MSSLNAGLPVYIRQKKIHTFTSSGIFYPSAYLLANGGVVTILFALGAGGGSGGLTAGGLGNSGAGNGGQLLKDIKVIVTGPVTVTIGAGGAAGANTGGPGGNGGNTTFGSLLTAYGGTGGSGNITNSTMNWGPLIPVQTSGCGAGALESGIVNATTSSDVNTSGLYGYCAGGLRAGGSKIYFTGTSANAASGDVAGISATANTGNGASCCYSATIAQIGGVGASGLLIISWDE